MQISEGKMCGGISFDGFISNKKTQQAMGQGNGSTAFKNTFIAINFWLTLEYNFYFQLFWPID
jgi:hypothetical protein